MPDTVEVWCKSPVKLAPIKTRVEELEKLRQISRVCEEAKISRNQLYWILRGKTNTKEETLRALLTALGMTWEQVAIP